MLSVAFGLLNDRSAAEDVVDDVFVAFAQSPEKIPPAGSLHSYLTTRTSNLARDRYRAIQRQARHREHVTTPAGEEPSPLPAVLRDEELRQLSDALGHPHLLRRW